MGDRANIEGGDQCGQPRSNHHHHRDFPPGQPGSPGRPISPEHHRPGTPTHEATDFGPRLQTEELDSDDSGVIKDVNRGNKSVDSVLGDHEESEDSTGTHKASSPASARSKGKPPKKWNYNEDLGDRKFGASRAKPDTNVFQSSDDSKSGSLSKEGGMTTKNIHFKLGDLVWGRQVTTCFYPAVISLDPHVKFFTKIVKSELGPSSRDPETGKLRLAAGDSEDTARQYHLQFLGDNRRMWLSEKYVMEYKGIAHYEQLAINDVKNINKIYKPKSEQLKTSWKDALLFAQSLEGLDGKERIRRVEQSRYENRARKYEFDSVDKSARKDSEMSILGAPTLIIKTPTGSAKKNNEADQTMIGGEPSRNSSGLPLGGAKKSAQYRRQEEMKYKMHRSSSGSSGARNNSSTPADSKLSSKKLTTGTTAHPATKITKGSSPVVPPFFPVQSRPVFGKSFKIGKKQDSKTEDSPESANIDKVEPAPPTLCDSFRPDLPEDEVSNSETPIDAKSDCKKEEETIDNDSIPILHTDKVERILTPVETTAAGDGMGEGALVWAKMRGYPYWPSIICRDPHCGDFVKVTDTVYKPLKKFHVLFLEYGSQRAWISSASTKPYLGIDQFNRDSEAASKSKKNDYKPGKRHITDFKKAVAYAEELSGFPDKDRLEEVLTKYGWDLVEEEEVVEGLQQQKPVTEEGSEDEVAELGSSNRSGKLDASSDQVNRTTDSETDNNSAPGDLTENETTSRVLGRGSRPRSRKMPSGRRPSTEAESRIDPGLDEPEQQVIIPVAANGVLAGKRARSSSNTNSSSGGSSTNGTKDRSSSRVGSKTASPARSTPTKSVKSSKASTAAKAAHAASHQSPMSVPVPAVPMTPSGTADKDEFPRLGDLVWGRMAGFPYWPSFVTRSPQGGYRKEVGSAGKASYHVQFFGWNDESGWVSSVVEFEGLEAFQQMGAKKKSDKTWNPLQPLKRKWEKAARDAEDTMGLSRQERIDQYFVSYAHKLAGGQSAAAKTSASPSPAEKPAKSSTVTTPKAKPVKTAKRKLESGHTVGPKSKKQAPLSTLPDDWRSESRIAPSGKLEQVFISPEGKEFKTESSVRSYLASCKAASILNVKYIEDPSLASGWKCQKIESSIFFFSPTGERFDCRARVAERMRCDNYSQEAIQKVLAANNRGPAPKSVKLKRGEAKEDLEDETDLSQSAEYSEEEEEEEGENVKVLPDQRTKYRYGGPYDEFLDLDKLFDGSSMGGGIIDMVQLPDVFLRHPTVVVKEVNNEMTISDVETGEFIAKKIIYE